jgi:Fe2+ transport system protein FeoA
MNLSKLPNRSKAVIKEITHPFLRTKLLEMGVTLGAEITLTLKAPLGGPLAFQCGNTQISIRLEDAAYIVVN